MFLKHIPRKMVFETCTAIRKAHIMTNRRNFVFIFIFGKIIRNNVNNALFELEYQIYRHRYKMIDSRS